MPRRLLLSALFGYFFTILPRAYPVVVAKDDSTAYLQAPADDFGFDNVAIVFNSAVGIPASGVYLGDGWIITAYHNLADGNGGFLFGSVTLAGSPYSADPSTATRLHTGASLADLAMFRLTSIPVGILSVSLSGTSPIPGTPVKLMGNGQDREPEETRWSAAWSEVMVGPGVHKGYELVGTRALRWGNNHVDFVGATPLATGFGDIYPISMDFAEAPANSGEAAAVFGDSGGGVFAKPNGLWELTGIVVSRTGFPGQPADAVVYGNSTIAANIADYRDEIVSTMAAVPEPGTILTLIGGASLLLSRRRRR